MSPLPARSVPALALLALAACAQRTPRAAVEPASAANVPDWVTHPPEARGGKLSAVGFSARTFWPQDAFGHAADDARGRLALALTSHVESIGLDSATATRSAGGEVDKEASDVVLQNSRIEATWVDAAGARGEPGGVFALATLDLGALRTGGAAAASWTQSSGAGVPAWLGRLPQSAGRLYATGYSGPTRVAEEAAQHAGEAAIDNLVLSLRSHVQAYVLLVESASGLSVEEFSRAENADDAFRDLVRKAAKLEATWVDADARKAGDPRGAVWALASIEVKSTLGGAQRVENPDLGPALDPQGNAPPGK